MPTIEISKKDLCSLIGRNLSNAQLEELLSYSKASLESAKGDLLKVEVADANRPDLWSAEGIARVIKGQVGKEKGMPSYQIRKSNFVVKVDGKVERVRPLVVCAVVKDLKLSKEAIEQIIQLQEKLCENFGLHRREAALGVYDFDKIKWPILYTTTKPDGIKFIPLEMQEPLTPRQILQRHEKGMKYAHLLSGCNEYPLLIDSAKEVLSMPPIINSNLTGKVTEKTRNVFIEVTGFEYRFIMPVLNVMIFALAERGGQLYSVEVQGRSRITTPDLKSKQATLDADYCNSILGMNLKPAEIAKLLERARFNVKTAGTELKLEYAPYRQDIMDSRDIIEDVVISYGYNNLQPQDVSIATIGKAADSVRIREKLIQLLLGLDMQEIATFTLTSKDNLFKRMHLPEQEVVELGNPISLNYSCLRNSLLPSALEFLSQNTKREFPQRIFEIGECFTLQEGTKRHIAVAVTSHETDFTEIKQILEYMLKQFGIEYRLKAAKIESFIEGRAGMIVVNDKIIGVIGEVHPKVLHAWNLKMPCAVFEIDLSVLH